MVKGNAKGQKEVKIKGQIYYRDIQGNLISAACIREAQSERISSPGILFPLLSEERVAPQEHFIVFTLDGQNKVINKHVVTKGLVNQSQIHPRETFYPAIKDNAVSIIVAHNHPSGNTDPSESDLAATKRLVEASKLLGIPLLDHLIVTAFQYVSLRDRYPTLFV